MLYFLLGLMEKTVPGKEKSCNVTCPEENSFPVAISVLLVVRKGLDPKKACQLCDLSVQSTLLVSSFER